MDLSAEATKPSASSPTWFAWWKNPAAAISVLICFAPLIPGCLACAGDWLVDGKPRRAVVSKSADGRTLVLENGLIRRTFALEPDGATTALDDLRSGASLLRGVRPEAMVVIDGITNAIGGLLGQRNQAFLTEAGLRKMERDPGSFHLKSTVTGHPVKPFEWNRRRAGKDLSWPPKGVAVDFLYEKPEGDSRGVSVVVHHEMYDGLPVAGKWLVISNGSPKTLTVDSFTSEMLACVEGESAVDAREKNQWRRPPIDVLSDYMFGGMDPVTASRAAVWETDPLYKTQVHYQRQTPCLLLSRPILGPGVRLAPGESLSTFRSYLTVYDSTERERQGLTMRRVWRTLAPWTTENPIMMHVRRSDSVSFRAAVDQCAEVGFEMIIYTFGSGIDMEKEDPAYIEGVRGDVDYAHRKGIQVGAYSLFSSRRINDTNDVIDPRTGKPGGAIFGNAPCFASAWGTNYYRKLTNFISQTGLDLLEMDGPYPGDVCASERHPGHRGLADSQWVQWRMSCDLFAWCRERGVYVNQPDCYFLAGANKTAMGYREDNWSLPRAEQLIHARQNIFDGTWTKTQSMGWMFVPLTEYQGGGAAATIEPLSEHLVDYEGHLANTLGDGVQACWRGPRLYDTDATKSLVRKWVSFFKEHRAILESDVIHCRRAAGRDLDYMVHVNPTIRERGFAMIHNPTGDVLEREIVLPLKYAGLSGKASIREGDGQPRRIRLDDEGTAVVKVRVPAFGRTWLVVTK